MQLTVGKIYLVCCELQLPRASQSREFTFGFRYHVSKVETSGKMVSLRGRMQAARNYRVDGVVMKSDVN